jgi:hypothetical protein
VVKPARPTGWSSDDPESIWSWRPSQTGWFAALLPMIERWSPSDRLQLSGTQLADAVAQSCARGDDWLVHPSANALMSTSTDHRAERDLAFVAWAARHVGVDGTLEIDAPCIVWTPGGGARVEPGTYTLATFARELDGAGAAAGAISIDPWCASAGVPIAQSWADREPESELELEQLAGMIRRYCAMLEMFERLLPACFEWVRSVTRVAVPLRPRDAGLHSHSVEELPGLVALDVPDDLVAFTELIVHESAHHHLFMADAAGPLVQPGHDGRYHSPLRTDPRPLRGVLLAYHALAYICAAYRELGERVRFDENVLTEQERLRSQLADASTVIASASDFLTAKGRAFVRLTDGVADYGAGHG